jgi:hypothetical protein
MPSPSLSAALIVRNEERFIRDCLRSIENSVDEIVVVDTGSSDDTITIARDFGARVDCFSWRDDFAAARNYSLGLCRTDWVLYIDADERLGHSSRFPIAPLLAERWLAADVLFQPKTNYTRYRLTRLLRVDPRLRFEGLIHETFLPSLKIASRDDPSFIGLTAMELDHIGYEGDLSAKHKRNLPLLQRCVVEHSTRVFYWFHLAETLLGLHSFEEAYSAGMKGIGAGEKSVSEKNRIDAAMICQMLGTSMLERGDDPLSILNRGLRLHAENFGIKLTLAQRELQFGDPLKAFQIASALKAVDPDSIEPGLIAYDRDIFGRSSVETQIAGLRRLGRLQEAAALVARNASLLSSSSSMPPRSPNKG